MNPEQKRVLSNVVNLLSTDVERVTVFKRNEKEYGFIGRNLYRHHEKTWKKITETDEDEELSSLFAEININDDEKNKELRTQLNDKQKEIESLKKMLEEKQMAIENLQRLLLQEVTLTTNQDEVRKETLPPKAMLPVGVVLNATDIDSIVSYNISDDASDDNSDDGEVECTFDLLLEEIKKIKNPSLENLCKIRKKYDFCIGNDKATKKNLIAKLKESDPKKGIDPLVSAGYKALRLKSEFGKGFAKSVVISPSSLHKSNIDALIGYIRNKQQQGQPMAL